MTKKPVKRPKKTKAPKKCAPKCAQKIPRVRTDLLGRRLTWTDLGEWAGDRSLKRGRTYARNGHVRGLSRLDDGSLVAWVAGTASRPYATRVSFVSARSRSKRLRSSCTCPVGSDECKHAVALIADWLAALAEAREIPLIDDEDPRCVALRTHDQEQEEEEDDDASWDEDFPEDEDEDDASSDEVFEATTARRKPKALPRRTTSAATTTRFLRALDRDALRALVADARRALPAFEAWLTTRRAVATRDGNVLRAQAEGLIQEMGAEPEWDGDGYGRGWCVPGVDLDDLESSLEALLEGGGADDVLDLGRKIVQEGRQAVDNRPHEDLLPMEIEQCLEVVWRALPRSTLSEADQVLYAIDLAFADDYGLVPDKGPVLRRVRKKRVWNEVADRLLARIEPPAGAKAKAPAATGWGTSRLVDVTVDALDRAGRGADADALREREVRRTGAYDAWVQRLLDAKRPEEAESWALEGLGGPERHKRGLHGLLIEAVKAQGAWKRLAALQAERFCANPSLETWRELLKAAGRARRKTAVREASLLFLEKEEVKGSRGGRKARKSKACDGGRWGLPAVEAVARREEAGLVQRRDARLEIALAEGRPDEILRCHALTKSAERGHHAWGYGYRSHDLAVARAVSKTHPEEALRLFDRRVEELIALTKPDAYASAAEILKTMRPLYRRAGRPAAWKARLEEIRTAHKRKRRLVEILDGLAGKPVVPRRRRR